MNRIAQFAPTFSAKCLLQGDPNLIASSLRPLYCALVGAEWTRADRAKSRVDITELTFVPFELEIEGTSDVLQLHFTGTLTDRCAWDLSTEEFEAEHDTILAFVLFKLGWTIGARSMAPLVLQADVDILEIADATLPFAVHLPIGSLEDPGDLSDWFTDRVLAHGARPRIHDDRERSLLVVACKRIRASSCLAFGFAFGQAHKQVSPLYRPRPVLYRRNPR